MKVYSITDNKTYSLLFFQKWLYKHYLNNGLFDEFDNQITPEDAFNKLVNEKSLVIKVRALNGDFIERQFEIVE